MIPERPDPCPYECVTHQMSAALEHAPPEERLRLSWKHHEALQQVLLALRRGALPSPTLWTPHPYVSPAGRPVGLPPLPGNVIIVTVTRILDERISECLFWQSLPSGKCSERLNRGLQGVQCVLKERVRVVRCTFEEGLGDRADADRFPGGSPPGASRVRSALASAL